MFISSGRFGFNEKLVVLEKGGRLKEFVKPKISQLVGAMNEAIAKRREELDNQKRKDRVQIVLDFSSLKDVMAKGGMIMSTFKCPNCQAGLPLPDEGQVMVCKYCNTPIKPVDIFEKVKSLME